VDRDDNVAWIVGVEGPVNVIPSWLAHGFGGRSRSCSSSLP
jgi:hypothetical protein